MTNTLITEKTCRPCGETKPLDGFNRHRRSRDGRASHCRDCQRQRKVQYRSQQHVRERERRYTEQWRAENPDYCREYLTRPEVRERRREYHAQYRAANRDRILERKARWRAKGAGSWEKYTERRQAYGLPIIGGIITRDEIAAAYGEACFHCGGLFEHIDHYPLPVRHPDCSHTLDNVKPACSSCNLTAPKLRPGKGRK